MQLQQGPGWRFGVDPQRQPYGILIGGEGWAAELRQHEAAALRQAALRLHAQWSSLCDQLMPEESVSLETECGAIWVELEGNREAVALRFVLQPQTGERGLEGRWSAEATQALLAMLAQAEWPEQQG